MKVLYRKSDGALIGKGGDFVGVGVGCACLELLDWSGLLDADGELLPGKTLADIPDAAERLKSDIRARIDAATGAAILAGFDHRGVRFKLTQEDQLNFANAYVARASLSYPLTVKGAGLVFLDLADASEVEAFYLTGLSHVQGCLSRGWADKLALDALTLAGLAAHAG